MKILLVLLGICLAAILIAAGAMLWRLRWHLRRPHATAPVPAVDIQQEHETIERS
ncbi:MAG TPA: hypothetical protein VFT65_01595 [Candidatus Angelobacter sp.]|nr:hypothetical protein [Candidatus Angelobacter sp.]